MAQRGKKKIIASRVDQKITAVIKTFERPNCLRRLLTSIRKYYPRLPVIIIDDSRKSMDDNFDAYTSYVHTQYNIGLNEGRNRGILRAKSTYIFLLDDDYLFTGKTTLEPLLKALEKSPYDLLALERIEGKVNITTAILFPKPKDDRLTPAQSIPLPAKGLVECDLTSMAFLASSKALRDCLSNPAISVPYDHYLFFVGLRKKGYRVAQAIGYASIEHYPDPVSLSYILKRYLKNYLPLGAALQAMQSVKMEGFSDKQNKLFRQYLFPTRHLGILEIARAAVRMQKLPWKTSPAIRLCIILPYNILTALGLRSLALKIKYTWINIVQTMQK